MVINTIHTPVGTFTRKSATAYAFAAIAEAAKSPEKGLRVVGNRKGDPALSIAANDPNGYPTERVRYHIVWSRTAAGARSNAESYVWQAARCVGVFPVEVANKGGKS